MSPCGKNENFTGMTYNNNIIIIINIIIISSEVASPQSDQRLLFSSTPHVMASILRQILLPQTSRSITARNIAAHGPSHYPAISHRAWSSLRTQSNVLPIRSSMIRRAPPIPIYASDFHYSCPKAILPPGPRRWPITLFQIGQLN